MAQVGGSKAIWEIATPHRGPFFKRASLRAEGRCEDLAGLPPRLYEFDTVSLLAMGVGDLRYDGEFHRLHWF